MDLTGLDLVDESYDLIFASHVLDVVADEEAAIRELHRVLAPSGAAIVQSPLHVGPSGQTRLVATLASAGFAADIESVPEQADLAACSQLGLLPDERLLLCRKL
jgi:ubiquinone/menaquinone biosynthesis C-methylase UbiE